MGEPLLDALLDLEGAAIQAGVIEAIRDELAAVYRALRGEGDEPLPDDPGVAPPGV